MTPLLEESRNAGRSARKVSPPGAGPGRIEPPTHPAVPRLTAGRLRFAPAPAEETDRPAAPARRRDSSRRDWTEHAFEAGWGGLLVACAAECARHLL